MVDRHWFSMDLARNFRLGGFLVMEIVLDPFVIAVLVLMHQACSNASSSYTCCSRVLLRCNRCNRCNSCSAGCEAFGPACRSGDCYFFLVQKRFIAWNHAIGQTGSRIRCSPPGCRRHGHKRILRIIIIAEGWMLRHERCTARGTQRMTRRVLALGDV